MEKKIKILTITAKKMDAETAFEVIPKPSQEEIELFWEDCVEKETDED